MVIATAIHTLDRDAGPLEGRAAGNWSLGIVEKYQGKVAVDCREPDQGDMREEMWWKMPVEESQAAMEARRYC